ncbi:Fe(3+)-hydroxamate ABC transporter permease FhuB [Roseomonas hellenica]|nr:Fe(3+)-hydroxamate ABC transporter permease FhuB [Plastoroseomonas hellenica]
MSEVRLSGPPLVGPRSVSRVGWIIGALLLAAALLAWRELAGRLPPALWWQAAFAPVEEDLRQVVVHYAMLPRSAVAILAGAALALAGILLQQVLRNPMAEPATLGVSAGASLALTGATLFLPGLLVLGREPVAFAGGVAALVLVLALSWRQGFAPLQVILAGMVVSLACGALSAVLVQFHHDMLLGLFIWGAGTLDQRGWDSAQLLLTRLAAATLLAWLLLRPLRLLELDEEVAASLGARVAITRLAGLGVAVLLAASVVSAVGLISFLGLATPALARLLGLRSFKSRLLWGPLLGAGLLWLTDQVVLLIPTGYRSLSTGAMVGFLGAPLLIWLLPRLPASPTPILARPQVPGRHGRPWLLLLGLLLLLLTLVWLALAIGQDAEGWHWASGPAFEALLAWRAPRVAAALACGLLLAQAGTLMQRMTGNPMAAPEVLGITSGAALGVIALIFTVTGTTRWTQMAAGAAGAFVVLAIMLALGRKSGFAPNRLILAGIALTALLGTMTGLVMASGDPRAVALLTWMAGSTYAVSTSEGTVLFILAAISLLLVPMLARWLDILPLGPTAARVLGLPLTAARLCLLLLTAAMTSVATLVVGPLSFVGLLAPQIARMVGLGRALHQMLGAALLGAVILVLADWVGRNAAFPFQIAAGLLATAIGGPALLWLLVRR